MVCRSVSGISEDLRVYVNVLATKKSSKVYRQWSGAVDVHLFIVCARIYEDRTRRGVPRQRGYS